MVVTGFKALFDKIKLKSLKSKIKSFMLKPTSIGNTNLKLLGLNTSRRNSKILKKKLHEIWTFWPKLYHYSTTTETSIVLTSKNSCKIFKLLHKGHARSSAWGNDGY